MAHDFEDIHDLEDLSDDEIQTLVREQLRERAALHGDQIIVRVKEGEVRLSGRVGTEEESRVAEHIVTDVLGIDGVVNDIAVDPVLRAEMPEVAEETLAEEEREDGLVLGDRTMARSPDAERLREGVDARLMGADDVQSSIEDGTAWNPPQGPTPEGISGHDG